MWLGRAKRAPAIYTKTKGGLKVGDLKGGLKGGLKGWVQGGLKGR